MTLTQCSLAPLALGCLLLSGCHVNEHKNGNNDNVSIETPFGNTSIKTNDNANTASIGLTVYPGAVPTRDDDKDNGAADINMSFGSFHLGVKAASFQTPDPESKVVAFYRKDMGKYGDVIECHGHSPVGQPDHTSQGLTCDDSDDHHKGVHADSDGDFQLRAGSKLHQHIVGVEQKNGGTKIGLVMLDLPSHMDDHDNKDSE